MAQRRIPIAGLEKFGVSQTGLRRLGSTPVTIEIDMPIPPYVYPSRASLPHLLRMAPSERRTLVREWRKRKYLALRKELPDGDVAVKRFNRDPVGVCCTLPARSIDSLRSLRHASMIWIRSIAGIRAKRSPAAGKRLFAVKGRMVFQVEGQMSGTQLCEERITAVVARSEREARARVDRLMRGEIAPYLSTSGDFLRWHFEGIGDVCECPDETFASSGTEIFYEYRKRRVRREHEWHPALLTKRLQPVRSNVRAGSASRKARG